MEVIAIKDEDSGLWNIVEAIRLERENRIIDRISPAAVSKSMPVTTILYACSSLFSARRLAVYLVMAELTPQSLKRIIM